MICLTTGRARFYNQRWSYANSLQVGGKSLKSFKEWNFSGKIFLSIALSLKDIELKRPTESFPWPLIYNWQLVENTLVWVKRPHSFKYRTRLSAVYAKWHWSIWHQDVSVSWLSSKKNVTLCLAVTARLLSEPKYLILRPLLRYSCKQELTKRASAAN